MNVRELPREYRELPIGLIDAPALPSRSEMDPPLLDELTASIRDHGILQPLSVARCGERYEVIAGHRRLLAAKRAGLVVAPAIVYASADAALEAIKYAENRHREELNAADEAIWFNELLERDCGGDVDRLCAQLGEKRSYIENRLNLFAGDEEIFRALQAGKIGIGVAQQLNRCTSQQYRRYLLHQAIVGGATVAVASGWIADWQREHPPSDRDASPSPATPAPAAVPETHFFTCQACARTDNVHLMRPLNFHAHCELAILRPALELWERRAWLLPHPRTRDEAIAAINDLADRFGLHEEAPRV